MGALEQYGQYGRRRSEWASEETPKLWLQFEVTSNKWYVFDGPEGSQKPDSCQVQVKPIFSSTADVLVEGSQAWTLTGLSHRRNAAPTVEPQGSANLVCAVIGAMP